MQPLLLDDGLRRTGLRLADQVRGLLLLVHAAPPARGDVGRAFVADVLRANRFAVISMSLHTPAEVNQQLPAPGMVQSKRRLREVFDWLTLQQPALGERPIGLIAFDRAVNACVGALVRGPAPPLRSLVLLDGSIARLGSQLPRLNVPSLFVLGHNRTRHDQHRSALRYMAAAYRLEMLSLPTLPKPARGALEAFACTAVDWLNRTLPTDGASKRPAVQTLFDGQRIAVAG